MTSCQDILKQEINCVKQEADATTEVHYNKSCDYINSKDMSISNQKTARTKIPDPDNVLLSIFPSLKSHVQIISPAK